MRILLDENIDRRLKSAFDCDCAVITVAERGWSGKKNGNLLRLAEGEFDVLVTMDKGIEYQHNISKLRLGVIVIFACSNRRDDVKPLIPKVKEAIKVIRDGMVMHIAA